MAALERFEGPLLRYARRLTGNLDRARDVVQETFLRWCCEKLPDDNVGSVDRRAVDDRIDGHANASIDAPSADDAAQWNGTAAWLFAVCRNRAIDVRRKERRMTPLMATDLETPAALHSPAELSEQSDAAERVRVVIASLPERQQEVLRLKFQNGLSYKEIAAVMKLSVTNVGFLLHTALKEVRARIGDGS